MPPAAALRMNIAGRLRHARGVMRAVSSPYQYVLPVAIPSDAVAPYIFVPHIDTAIRIRHDLRCERGASSS